MHTDIRLYFPLLTTTLCVLYVLCIQSVQACTPMIYSKWDDLLFVDNGERVFTSYQWYCDGEAIPNQTRQYLYIQGVTLQGDGHVYHAVAYAEDGRSEESCAGTFDEFPRSATLNSGFPERAVLFTYNGDKVGEWSTRPESLSVAPGVYIWQLTYPDGIIRTEKVVK